MATHINGVTITSPYSSPKISYDVGYKATRLSNKQVEYVFTVKSYIEAYGWFGTGYILKSKISVAGVSEEVTLKSKSTIWNNRNGSKRKLCATHTVSITVSSQKAGEEQKTTFTVTRPDGLGNSGKVQATGYYVKTPALLTTRCGSPKTFTVLPEDKNQVRLSWSGASDGEGNKIQQYRIRYATSETNIANNNSWEYKDLLTTDKTEYLADMTGLIVGKQYVKFAVRAEGSAGSTYYSYYTYSDAIQMDIVDDPLHRPIGVVWGGEWIEGLAYIMKDGIWVPCNIQYCKTEL